MSRLAKPLAALLALSALVACGTKSDQKAADSSAAAAAAAAAQPKSLYDRLGGTTAIASVVDAFVANVASDARINKRFTRVAKDTAAMRQFKQKLVDQICQGSGGPCTYTGKDMKTAHQGMGIKGADFDALVQDLVKALDGAGVPQKEKDDLLAVLGPMTTDIVTK
jgi:hemoglobin